MGDGGVGTDVSGARTAAAMIRSIARPEVLELLDAGAQLVEAMPAHEYEEEHLPGAVNRPLKKLDAAAVADLDQSRPVIVYCWDSL